MKKSLLNFKTVFAFYKTNLKILASLLSVFCRRRLHCTSQFRMAIWLMAHPPPRWNETKKIFYPRESADQDEVNASTECIFPSQSVSDLNASSPASFLHVQPKSQFSLQPQEEAKIRIQVTNKFELLTVSK